MYIYNKITRMYIFLRSKKFLQISQIEILTNVKKIILILQKYIFNRTKRFFLNNKCRNMKDLVFLK